ncbi:MAG TPA: BTAD domain-containing putative transcriptional regulator [Candidatus Limnocylindrales bacterium]|nr:BTAD domain-containing putative transcriptional regulator [Candidatus Limnocylindrales bacterium]
MAIDFRVLGPLEVVEDGVSLRLGGPRPRALLAALLVETDRFVSRDRLIDELWGDDPPATAENALQAQVAALRRLLPGRILTGGTSYRLTVRPDEVDARRFELDLAEARGLLGRQPARAAAQLATALDAWRGPALDGDATGLLAGAEATRLDALRRAAQVERADACLSLGEAGTVVDELSGLVAGDPTDERLAGRLMVAQYRTSGSADALATFERVEQALDIELGATPEAALLELRLAIERHDPTLAGPTSGLPTPATRFVGRERDLAEALDLLGRSRLLTLVGPGGCGKSRLALELGRAMSAGRPADVHLISLATLAPGGSATRLIADVLDVRERRGESLIVALLERLRPQRSLLILDNCEHVLALVAGLCAELLAGAPGLRILATSREPLGAPGEVTLGLSGLALPAPGATPAEIRACDSVQLLLDRAVAVRPGFELTDLGLASAASLCRRLDGLPLAIELAAARLRTLSLEEILIHLEGRLDLPVRPGEGVVERHRTMRAAINWSHDLLSPPERRMLRQLAVFRGHLDLPAATAVWGPELAGDDPFAALCRLVDQSMVVAEPSLDGPTTYRLLETIRQYAEERLADAGESQAARDRHAAWCAGLVAAAGEWGGSDQEVWLVRLGAAHNDLLAGLTWWLGDGTDPAAALAMTAGLWWYWYVRGHVAEGLVWLRRTLAASTPEPSRIRTIALRGASALARSSGDYAEAIRFGEQCLAMCRELAGPGSGGDRQGIAGALNSLSATALAMGQVEDAIRYGEESLVEVRGSGNQRGLGASLTNLGTALRNADRFDEADAVLREAADVFDALGDVRGETSAIINRAIVERRRGQLESARACCLEALRLCVVLGHAEGQVDCLDVVATIEVAEGRFAVGLRLFEVVRSARRRLGLEVSTPDERHEREEALRAARAALDPAQVVAIETGARAIDIGDAAIAELAT